MNVIAETRPKMDLIPASARLAVIGLGYVGLPLAAAFGRLRPTLGFDIKAERIAELQSGSDFTRQLDQEDFAAARHLAFSADSGELSTCDVFVIAVPTPIDQAKRPDLRALTLASETVGAALAERRRRGNLSPAVVIYESTVYPGCTREHCMPILAERAGLVADRDFFTGYSPERMNPGDKVHGLASVVKVTSGSTPEAAAAVDALYRSIVTAGTHLTATIEIAEAAKVIENTQRDINIALMNELAVIFSKLDIDTKAVLEAASTKWNFLRFRPGLVGGHCIGVDPYYLTHRAQQFGHHPEMILAGRRINDSMGHYVVDQLVRLMMRRRMPVVGSKILVMGVAYKKDVPDLRNSRVADIVAGLKDLNAEVEIYDPVVPRADLARCFGAEMLIAAPEPGTYAGIVLAVPHTSFIDLGIETIRALGTPDAVLFDVDGVFDAADVDGRL